MHLCINHHLSVMSVMSRLEAEDRNAETPAEVPAERPGFAQFGMAWNGRLELHQLQKGGHVKIMAWLSLKAFLPNQIVEEGTMNKLSGHKLSELFQSCTLHVGSRWCFQTNAISYPCLVWSAHFKHRTHRVKGRWLFRVVSIHWAILAELVLWVLQYFMEVPINQLEERTVGYKYIESIYRVELLKQPTYPYLFHIFVG